MAINVTTSMTYENREFLRNTAKHILTKNGASQEASSKIAQSIIFENKEFYSNAQLDALKASVQYTINGGLKRKENSKKKEKKRYILGELWNSLESDEKEEKNELYDFTVDFSRKNIFEAA